MSDVEREDENVQDVYEVERRERKTTEKGEDYRQERIAKHEKAFHKNYTQWKVQAKAVRSKLKEPCSEEQLQEQKANIEKGAAEVQQEYEALTKLCAPSPEVVNRMDTCGSLTKETSKLIELRTCHLGEEAQAHMQKERVRMILNKEACPSVFGNSAMETQLSRVSEKELDAEADRAAKKAELDSRQVIQKQQAKLIEMEADWKKKEAELQADMKRQEAEMFRRMEAQKLKLQELDAEREAKVAEARAKAYQDSNRMDSVSEQQLNPLAEPFCPNIPEEHLETGKKTEVAVLREALVDSMTLSRLPAPEPCVYTGDTLQYVRWKTSFKTLIENKGLSSAEKMFYLQRYLGGPALKAVEGFFYNTTEESYTGAWKTLDERYGHHFKVQEAFREKLSKWPKISVKDAAGFQEFADFLKSCKDAMPQIKGLCILNDCKENQRLASRLPDWAAMRWNRQVTQAIEEKGDYPDFSEFVEFVSKEARIVCNPITSLGALKEAGEPGKAREVQGKDKVVNSRHKGTALATKTKETEKERPKEAKNSTNEERKCNFCKMDGHNLVTCFKFEKQTPQEKRAFVQDNRLCFGCLKVGHRSRDCRIRHTCRRCKGKHPTIMHEDRNSEADKQVKETASEESNQVKERAPEVSCKAINGEDTCSTSMIVPVWLSTSENPTREVLTYAMLDTQSSSTFVLKEVAKSVTSRLVPVRLKLSTMTSVSSFVETYSVPELTIRGMTSTKRIKIPVSYTQDFIPFEQSQIPTAESAQRWPHLKHVGEQMAALQTCGVGLLLGYNCHQALIPRETVVGKDDEPYAVKTDLGWTIVGGQTPCETTVCHKVKVNELPEVSPREALAILQADFADTSDGEERMVSQEDLHFLDILKEGIVQTDRGHLKMPLPFRSGRPSLPNNRKTAASRLEHLKRKFQTNPAYYKDYVGFMERIIRDGDAERADDPVDEGQVWYIPHHGVYHPKKPDKIRVVFDCSARHGSVSLNGHLLTGPDLLNGLTGVLCRFREHPIALMCDIERMFHQFLVKKEHRDYLRFLWWENGDVNTKPREYRMKVHLFGAASSPGCANFGMKFLAEKYKAEFPEAAKFIKENFYVDDGLQSCKTEAEAKSLIRQAQELCSRGGLHLHKFVSNNRKVLEAIPPSERAAGVTDVDLCHDKLPSARALGIRWCVETDTFGFLSEPMDQAPTRRGILSAVASMYDPLGFIAPFVLRGKAILQETCHRGISWDEPIAPDLLTRWREWKSDSSNLGQVQIPRCFYPHDFGVINKVELHHFSDASNTGYGQCSYMRIISDGNVHCSLISGKSRVAPIKMVTIPRLELTAALVSVLMSKTLKKELQLQIDREYFWTDSQVVLSYINSDAKRFHTFVANRVQKIRQITQPNQWHYVSTEENPADHASRGMSVTKLLASNWFSGPDFLWSQSWEPPSGISWKIKGEDPEVRKVTTLSTKTTKAFNVIERLTVMSKWSKAVRAIARLKRIAKAGKVERVGLSSCSERAEAENFIVKSLQSHVFPEEVAMLQRESEVKSTSQLYNLDPYLDEDGVLRVGGRLRKAKMPDPVKHPAILPRDSHVTTLVIRYFHEKSNHQGRGITLNEIRANGYWIIGGTKAVQSYIQQCVICRKARRSVEEQRMADLPEVRLEPSAPFTYCGMDCFGPFIVKRGRKECKRYGLILTCLCSRAVHVEMLDDMSTDCLINALRCFIAIRGAVKQFKCDQGSNFIGARNELRQALKEVDHSQLERFLAENQCEFKFNAPSASHAGGVWERQIKSLRSVLNITLALSSGRLDDSSLRTFLYEAMAIVNSRPLAVDSISDPTAPEPLTPNHILTMKSIQALPPPGRFPKEDLYIAKRWRRVQHLCEVFWNRWKKEYLYSLNERKKWQIPRRNLKVGDVVMLKDDASPRLEWPLALVTEAREDDDALVRRVKVTVGRQRTDAPRRELERPVQQLVLLVESA